MEICYRDEGKGQPLVFLHAFPLDQSMWDDQVSHFATGYRVITLDWRGFGKSSLGEGPSTMAAFASDLAGLLDSLKIERATICGLSMGGYAAMAFLREHGHRVQALVLADTRATADTDEARQNRLKMAALARGGAIGYCRSDDLEAVGQHDVEYASECGGTSSRDDAG